MSDFLIYLDLSFEPHIGDTSEIYNKLEKQQDLTARERLFCNLKLAQDQSEFIQTASFDDSQGSCPSSNFVQFYGSILPESLRNLILFIERIIALAHSQKSKMSMQQEKGLEAICLEL